VDPVSMVLTALAAGAGAGVKETASAAVKDAYGALREALAERFRGKASAEVALVEHASSPQTWQAPLAQYVEEIGVDERLLQLAQGLLQALQVGQAGQGQGGAGHALPHRGHARHGRPPESCCSLAARQPTAADQAGAEAAARQPGALLIVSIPQQAACPAADNAASRAS